MESTILHFSSACEPILCARLAALGCSQPEEGHWLFPSAAATTIISWYRDFAEYSPERWQYLRDRLGRAPATSLVLQLRPLPRAKIDARQLVLWLLSDHHGVVDDDVAPHLWTLSEIRDDVVVHDHRFLLRCISR